MRAALTLSLLLFASIASAQGVTFSGVTHGGAAQPIVGWRPVRIGAGGYVTGVTAAPDGSSRCIRTDTIGAFCMDAGQSSWRQLVSATTIPAGNVQPGNGSGAFEVAISPSLPTRMYMAWSGHMFRSDDRGAHWILAETGLGPFTADGSGIKLNANGYTRLMNGKLAVNPTDPNTVIFGSPLDGAWRTTNGGTGWSQIATIPSSASRVNGIAFLTGGVVWLGADSATNPGVYKSTDSGATFALVTGGPNGSGVFNGAGRGSDYYAVACVGTCADSGTFKIWRNSAGSWTDCTPAGQTGMRSIAAEPSTSQLIVASDSGSVLVNDNAACSTANWRAAFLTAPRVCTDAPWLCEAMSAQAAIGTNQLGLITGGLAYDPSSTGKVWLAGGIGAFFTTVPAPGVTAITWTSQITGTEQLSANMITVPPGGVPVTASWDFSVMKIDNPEVYQQHYENGWPAPKTFDAAWNVEWASSDPNFLVTNACWWDKVRPSYSTDKGATWNNFIAIPTAPTNCDTGWGRGGSIAASTPLNWIWVTSGAKAPYYTVDQGATWNKLVVSDGAHAIADQSTDYAGWKSVHENFFLNRHIIAADRVTPNVFYLASYINGIFRSVDSGATWQWRHAPLKRAHDTGIDNTGFNAKLIAVPGQASDIFFTAGDQGSDPSVNNPDDSQLWHSIDGGATWNAIANLQEVFVFGFGKDVAQAGGGTYPTLYAVGWYLGSYGVWKSVDKGVTFTQLGESIPAGILDMPAWIDADKEGDRVFMGFRGAGYAYYTPSAVAGFACSDGVDNDNDGIADYPGDAGCSSPYDTDESGDDLVVVSADTSAANLLTCIGGANASGCTFTNRGTGAGITVCGSPAGSICGTPTHRTITGQLSPSRTGTALNYIDTTGGGIDIRQTDIRFVNSKITISGPNSGNNSGGFEIGTYAGPASGFVMDHSELNGVYNAGSNTCNYQQTMTNAANLRLTNNSFHDICPIPAADTHGEAFYVERSSDNAFISGNTWLNNGGTAHLFFTDGSVLNNYPTNVCVTGNIYQARWDGTVNDVSIRTPDSGTPGPTTIYLSPTDTSANPPVDRQIPTPGETARACPQCNDGVDNDGDGKIDYWPDGNGDSGCTSASDTSE